MAGKIGIICASDEELAPFLPHIQDCSVTEKAMLKIYEGTICGVPAAVLFSGVCKVNAAIAAQILIDAYHTGAIINAGVAGGMDKRLAVFDTVVSTEVCYHDVSEDVVTEFHPWMKSVWFPASADLLALARRAAAGNGKVFFGRTVTGEAFIEEENRDEINKRFQPLSVDMETAAIAHACYVNHIPFIAIRTITDTAEYSGNENFERNCKKASEIAKNITLHLLTEMKNSEF